MLDSIKDGMKNLKHGKWREHYDEEGNCLGCGESWRKHTVSARAKGSMHEASKRTEDIVWCNVRGKNPGDVIYNKSKPYAVQERSGTIYYRDLPEMEMIRKYITKWRHIANITIDELETVFDNYTPHHWFEKNGSYPTREDWIKLKSILKFDEEFDKQMITLYPKPAEKVNNPIGKNPGDVLFINTRPYKEAHFATFPVDLPLFILKCACPKQVCKKCGEPRYPIPDSEEFTKCSCDKGFRPGIVLDPFFGSGTTALAADQLGLWWTGIELSKEYIEIARERLKLKEQL